MRDGDWQEETTPDELDGKDVSGNVLVQFGGSASGVEGRSERSAEWRALKTGLSDAE